MNLLNHMNPLKYMMPTVVEGEQSNVGGGFGFGDPLKQWGAGARESDFKSELTGLENVTSELFAKNVEVLITHAADSFSKSYKGWGQGAVANFLVKIVGTRGIKNFMEGQEEDDQENFYRQIITAIADVYGDNEDELNTAFGELSKAYDERDRLNSQLNAGQNVVKQKAESDNRCKQAEKIANDKVKALVAEGLELFFPNKDLELSFPVSLFSGFIWSSLESTLVEETYNFMCKDVRHSAITSKKNQQLANSFSKLAKHKIQENKETIIDSAVEILLESESKEKRDEIIPHLKGEFSAILELVTDHEANPTSLFLKRIITASVTNVLESYFPRSGTKKVDEASQNSAVETLVDICVSFMKGKHSELLAIDKMAEEHIKQLGDDQIPEELFAFLGKHHHEMKEIEVLPSKPEFITFIKDFYPAGESVSIKPEALNFFRKHYKKLEKIKGLNKHSLEFISSNFETIAKTEEAIHDARVQALESCFLELGKKLTHEKGVTEKSLHLPEIVLKSLKLDETLSKVFAQAYIKIFYPQGKNYQVLIPVTSWIGGADEEKLPDQAKVCAKAISDYAEKVLLPDFIESGYAEKELIIPELKKEISVMNPDDESLKRLVEVAVKRVGAHEDVKTYVQNRSKQVATQCLSEIFQAIESKEKENPNFLHDVVVKSLKEAKGRISSFKKGVNDLAQEGLHLNELMKNKEFLKLLVKNSLELAGITKENLPSPHAMREKTWEKLINKIGPDLIRTTLSRKLKMELFERKYLEAVKAACTAKPGTSSDETPSTSSDELNEEIGATILKLLPDEGTSLLSSLWNLSFRGIVGSLADKALRFSFIRRRVAAQVGATLSDTLKQYKVSDLLKDGLETVAETLNDEVNGEYVEPPKATDHDLKYWTKELICQSMDKALQAPFILSNKIHKMIDKGFESYLGIFGKLIVKLKHFVGFILNFIFFRLIGTLLLMVFAPVVDLIRYQWKRTKEHFGGFSEDWINRVHPNGQAICQKLKPEIETGIKRHLTNEEVKPSWFSTVKKEAKEATLLDEIMKKHVKPAVEKFTHQELTKKTLTSLEVKIRPYAKAIETEFSKNNGDANGPIILKKINKILELVEKDIKRIAERTPSRIEGIARDYLLRGADAGVKGLLAGKA